MRTGLIIVAALTLGFAPLPRVKTDTDRLKGAWVSGELEARFEKDRLTYYRRGERVNVYRITLDETATPKRYVLVGIGGGAADGRRYSGIYRLDKDELRMAARGWGEPRPDGFVGPDAHVETFTRKGVRPALRKLGGLSGITLSP
jgi:uncharacterized protein (TIGR03067 family)